MKWSESSVQESNVDSPPESPPVVFTLGKPLEKRTDGDNTAHNISSDRQDPPSDPGPSDSPPCDPQMGKESTNAPSPSNSNTPGTGTTTAPITNTTSGHNESSTSSTTTTAVSNNPVTLNSSQGHMPSSEPVNIPQPQPQQGASNSLSLSPTNSKPKHNDDSEENDESKSGKEETIAESSLPWRRQTTLPPVPSSVSLGIPDDENPLMSEAPSWADNLAYSHLTETGSPYHSPENTVTSRPAVTSPRPVFDIFAPSSPPPEETPLHAIPPPPWSIKDRNPNDEYDEPIPSQSLAARDAGDKASCLLVSSHDVVPPSYHSCLQPNRLEPMSSRRHSEASSPVHFQFMEKPDSFSLAAIESQLIGIEEDYHHGMKDRVSRWLASTPNEVHCDEIDPDLARKEEGERILESLRKKKEKWVLGDGDDGTDADVESDDDLHDTKL